MGERRRWETCWVILAAVAVAAVPSSALGTEVKVSGAVDKAQVGSATLRVVVESSAGGWISDDTTRMPGTHRISGLSCGRTVRHFELWTPQTVPPREMTVSASFTLEGPSVRNVSAGSIERHAMGSLLRSWHHQGADFDLVLTLDCTEGAKAEPGKPSPSGNMNR